MKPVRTLILTSGTHVVSADVAKQILEAINSGTPTLRVPVDFYCDGSNPVYVDLVLRHVVGVVEEQSDECDYVDDHPKVRRLRG